MFFLLSSFYFNSSFTIPVVIEHARLELALAIPTSASVKVANDAIEMLPVVTDRTINGLLKYSK